MLILSTGIHIALKHILDDKTQLGGTLYKHPTAISILQNLQETLALIRAITNCVHRELNEIGSGVIEVVTRHQSQF